jgi:hypothetical protein
MFNRHAPGDPGGMQALFEHAQLEQLKMRIKP